MCSVESSVKRLFFGEALNVAPWPLRAAGMAVPQRGRSAKGGT